MAMSLALAAAPGIQDAQKKKAELENKKASTQEMITGLQSLKSDANAYISQLDEDLRVIRQEIEALNAQKEILEAEIAENEKELKEVERTLIRQYGDMKLRIKYMYERGNSLFLDTLFDAKSFTDMLNKSEYINKISVYDRTRMEAYERTQAELSEKKAELEKKEAKLDALVKETEQRRKDTETLLEEKEHQLAAYQSEIDNAKGRLSEYDQAIKEQEDTIKAIEAEIKRKEEEARKRAEAEGKKYKTVNLGDIHFIWPCPSSSTISSYFGGREAPTAGASTNHKGIDIAASTGDSILAAASGEVIISEYSSSAGNYVMINHGGGVYTVYMHASERLVDVGDKVEQGQEIAKVGSTGYSTGAHLHFGIRADGDYINPLNYVAP